MPLPDHEENIPLKYLASVVGGSKGSSAAAISIKTAIYGYLMNTHIILLNLSTFSTVKLK